MTAIVFVTSLKSRSFRAGRRLYPALLSTLALLVILGLATYLGVRRYALHGVSEDVDLPGALPGPQGNQLAAVKPSHRPVAKPGTTRPESRLSYAQLTGSLFTASPSDPYRVPRFLPVDVPEVAGGLAVWGATGRDRRGHIWFGISTRGGADSPAHLCEYLPESDQVVDRGNVLAELKRCGVLRAGEAQQKIHSRIIHAADGNLYFASMDEQGEDEQGGRLPKWGSHFWRLRLPENRWEHLFAAPEGLIAVAGVGQWMYALGYFKHVLYQYHVRTGEVRSLVVGSVDGHISRNFLCDDGGHAYVPRLRRTPDTPPRVQVSLVEFDTQLREVGQTPLRNYTRNTPTHSHGIVGFQYLADRSIAMVTDVGFLYRVAPAKNGPATVTELGWFHPRGEAYVATMFTFSGERHLLGVSSRENRYEWLVYDLQTNRSQALAIPDSEPIHRASYVYGSVARDNGGAFYCVGGWRQAEIELTAEHQRALDRVGVAEPDLAFLKTKSHPQDRPIVFRILLPSSSPNP